MAKKSSKYVLSFFEKCDDYWDLYIRNLENPRLKPVFRYTITI